VIDWIQRIPATFWGVLAGSFFTRNPMTERQWIWGLSNGVLVLALSGFVWASLGLGVGFRPAVAQVGLDVLFPPLAVLNLTVFVVLLGSGIRKRRRAWGISVSRCGA
jgi:hypothetical protein